MLMRSEGEAGGTVGVRAKGGHEGERQRGYVEGLCKDGSPVRQRRQHLRKQCSLFSGCAEDSRPRLQPVWAWEGVATVKAQAESARCKAYSRWSFSLALCSGEGREPG